MALAVFQQTCQQVTQSIHRQYHLFVLIGRTDLKNI